MLPRIRPFAVLAILAPSLSAAQIRPAPTVTKVAEGVYLFTTPSYTDVGLDGNAVAILSDDGVLVFDSNGTKAASALVLAEIRKLTNQPVRYVVNSHWHWDHWYGTDTYRRANPGLVVIAHEKNRAMMLGPALEFNRAAVESQLPDHVKEVESALASDTTAAGKAKLEAHLAGDRLFLDQKKNADLVPANLTYSDSITIYLGRREIRVLHHDRAVTPGDTYLYLPQDKILITGDLLVNPISFALVSYPTGWLSTLETLDRTDAAVIVPGHGAVLHDKRLLEAHIALFRILLEKGTAARDRGLDPDQAKAEILPTLGDLRAAITGGDASKNGQFDFYLVDWYLHRVYDELAGLLSDSIGPVPRH